MCVRMTALAQGQVGTRPTSTPLEEGTFWKLHTVAFYAILVCLDQMYMATINI